MATATLAARGATAVALLLGQLSSIALADQSSEEARAASLSTPTSSSATGTFSNKAQVEASSEKTTATVSLARFKVLGGEKLLHFAVTGKSSFDSDSDDVKDMGSLSGLSAGASVRGELGYMKWPHFSSEVLQDEAALCSRYISAVLPGYFWSGDQHDPRGQDKNLGAPQFNSKGLGCHSFLDHEKLVEVVKALNEKAEADAKKANLPAPALIKLEQGAEATLKEGKARLEELNAKGFKAARGLSLFVTANRKEAKYLDAAAATGVSKKAFNGQGVGISYLAVFARSLFTAGWSYERSYKTGAEAQYCAPVSGTSTLKCVSALDKAPEKEIARIVFAEYRRFLGHSGIAIAPHAEYETGKSEFAFKLPIYFADVPSHPLNGGIALGWDETDKWSAAVFVGKSFKFLD